MGRNSILLPSSQLIVGKSSHPLGAEQKIMVRRVEKKITTTYPYLPDELVFDGILKRLSAECLVKFSCVSKSWYAAIHDPAFVRSIVSGLKGTVIIGILQVRNKKAFDYIFTHKGLRLFNIHTTAKWTCQVGSVNGLYCFLSRSGIEICNPIMGELLYNPLPPPPPPHCLVCYGFGFDALLNEYKLVQFVIGNNGDFCRCMIYTVGDDSTWKDITCTSKLLDCLESDQLRDSGGVGCVVNPENAQFLDESLHWYFYPVNMVISFDIHHERFSLIAGPLFYYRIDPMFVKSPRCFVIKWQRCLCVGFQLRQGGQVDLYRYVTDTHDRLPDYDPADRDIWRKNRLPLPYNPRSKVGVLDGDSYLLCWWSTAAGCVSLYHPDIEKEEKIKFPLPKGIESHSVGDYSLAPLVENYRSLKTFLSPENAVKVKSISSL